MKLFSTVVAAVILATASSAHSGTLSGYADVTSNYVSRGTAQNVYGHPSLQGGLAYTTANGWYASTFASTMNYGEGTTKELDFFGGKRWTVGKTSVDVGFANINYPDNKTPLNFIEYDVKVDHPLGKGSVGAWLGYTSSYFNVYGEGIWTEVHASYPVTEKISVSGSLAKQSLPNNFGYNTFNVGATYAVSPTVSFDLRYSDTDRHDLDPVFGTYGREISATLTRSF